MLAAMVNLFASLRTVLAVATMVDLMREIALEATHSLYIPLPGSPGLKVLWRMRQMPVMNVVAFLWLYWPLVLVRRLSFAMLKRTCSHVVARAVKHASAMIGHVGRKKN
jgi:hypothetical protein